MAWRDSRSSRRRLLLFSSSISLGIAALVAIGSLGRNLQQAIKEQAKALLGADLVLVSRQPFSPQANELFARLGGEQASETSFSTMLVLTNGTRLVNARALDGAFPFYGRIETDPPEAADMLQQGGGVLVEESILQQFAARRGDLIRLGNATFPIRGSLLRVPGDTVAFATLAPRVYLAAQDLPKTDLLRPGSLARHKRFFRLDPAIDVDQLVKAEEANFKELRLQSDTIQERQRDLGNSLANLYRFLNLVALVALILGAVGIASAIQVHVRQRLANVAVLRCLGASLAQTFGVYLVQGLALGAVGTVGGLILGGFAASQLPNLVRGFLPFTFEAHFDWIGAVGAAVMGFAICFLFALLPLLEVRRVSPLAAIRAAYESRSERDPLRWLVAGVIVVGIAAFAIWQTRRWQEGLGFAAGLVVAFALLAAAGHVTMWLARRLVPRGLPFAWRQGLASLHRPHNRTTLLLVAIGLGTFLMLTLQLTRDVLLRQLFPEAEAGRPNAILFDIQPDQREGVIALLQQQQLPVLDSAPIVTMRLSRVKGVPVDQLATNKPAGIPDWILRREFRSTWRTNLNESETVRAGVFIPSVERLPSAIRQTTNSEPSYPVSVEEGIAKDMKVRVGDELIWDIQGVPLVTYVASVREVDWRQVRPNFFVVFPEGSLEAAPAMWVLATRVSDADESARMQRTLVTAFPNVSAIDLTLVLKTLDGVLTKVGFVIRFMALFTVVTGLIVLAGAVVTGRWQRVQESILLRTLGASRGQIRRILLAEYATLGLLASVTAVALSVVSSWALARFAFEASYSVSLAPLLIAVMTVTLLTVVVGLLTSRGIADQPPLEILRQEA
ncbi:MAG TPA: ABC transporter permease [Verrucomicrobiales bacterium]|nr:ABC transporter permease [Verrucomicrobiales bacterium]